MNQAGEGDQGLADFCFVLCGLKKVTWLEVLAMSADMRTHLNILQDEPIWTSCRNDCSEWDVTIVLGVEGALLCEWPEPVPSRWEALGVESSADTLSANTSMETGEAQQMSSGVPESVQRLVKTLGGRPCHEWGHCAENTQLILDLPHETLHSFKAFKKTVTCSWHSVSRLWFCCGSWCWSVLAYQRQSSSF